VKRVTPFKVISDLILVPAQAWGPYGHQAVRLALDTGAVSTTLAPKVMDHLGYDVRDGMGITRVVSAVGMEEGYRQRLARFSALGFEVLHFPVHVFDLPEQYGLDGLLGLNFLRKLNYEVRSQEHRVFAEAAAA
jgi:predicted aspartyl protease